MLNLTPKIEKLHPEQHHLGINITHLIEITKQRGYKMPSGLTRKERRKWAKSVKNDVQTDETIIK